MQKFSFRQIIEISNGFKGGFSPCLMKRAKVHFNAPRVGRKDRQEGHRKEQSFYFSLFSSEIENGQKWPKPNEIYMLRSLFWWHIPP